MNDRPTISVSTWLALLVLGAVVPLLLFAGATLFKISKDARAAKNQGQADTAQALALAVDGEIRSWKAAMTALAASRILQRGRLAEFDAEARLVAAQHEGWIVLTVSSGQQLVNTLRPYGTPLPTTSSPETINAIFAGGKPVVSDVFYGKVTQGFLVAVGVPVWRDGKVVNGLTLNFSPQRLTRLLESQKLPSSWVAAINDRQYHVVARSRNIEQRVGKPVVPWLAAAEAAADRGMATGPLVDGRLGQVAFQRLQEVPWVVSLAVPVVELPSAMPLVSFLLVGALVGCAAVGVGLYTGRKITAPVARLAAAGEPMLRGVAVELGTPSGIREVRALQQALGEAAAAVQGYYQERERAAIAAETAKLVAASAQALRESEERLQLFIKNAPAAIAMFDCDMRYLAVSRRWMTDYGLGDRDIVGQSHYEVFPDIPHSWKTVHQRGLAGEVVQATEDRFERSDGTVRWLRWEVRPWRKGDGAVGGIILFTEDITERKRADEALQQAHDDLERRVEERTAELSQVVRQLEKQSTQLRALASELTLAEQRERHRVATVLHDDLQQILVGMKLVASPLAQSEDPKVREAGCEVSDLITRCLQCSRSLTEELSPPILHRGGLVPAMEWLVRWMAEKHHLTVVVHANKTARAESHDTTVLLFQAIRELLFNVAKYAQVDAASVAITHHDNQIQVQVTDQGAGFDPTQLRVAGGTAGGFGLFNIRERLELIGGRLEIDSAPGKGSRFTLWVPGHQTTTTGTAAPAPTGAELSTGAVRAEGASPSASDERKIRVLVVDDHLVVRQGLVRLLKEEPDIEVVGEAADGQTAVALTRELSPDVVTMDIEMPGMNGIEATRLICTECPAVRVIGLSMYEVHATAMREAGAVAYLTKSGPSDTLIAAIRGATRA